ncbi:ABC transporter G family member 20-like [Oppia nitens]|uniref:ABC transporter G family member 20-like n=1 Tax=Oppia nitens TaxID=1686743 RepID=UPI0023DA19F9|nr:ABC transporter G family member 20-like [Oppia nitens]
MTKPNEKQLNLEMDNKNSINDSKKISSFQSLEKLDLNNLTVKIRNMSFSYHRIKKGVNILNNINMSLPNGAIYGLLGPSGCGKTTLLKLILGLKTASNGTIEVNGRQPLHPLNNIPGHGVGFQPQEIALYPEFSIRETLNYFAQIYGIKDSVKNLRIDFLIDFLSLPNPDSAIRNLSGGQQRRVSLAVAIVHSPPILILDEPTVGVDPMLRERVWDHLVSLSREEKTTILVTTHYVEEARRAHVIALMRSGRLLVEQSPKYLLNYFGLSLLEEIFLRVCQSDENPDKAKQVMPKSFIETTEPHKTSPMIVKPTSPRQQTLVLKPNHWKRFKSLTRKNYVRISRNLLVLVFQILMPTLSMILFCICIGRLPHNLKVAVYNEEDLFPNGSGQRHECRYNNFSHYFIDSIDKEIVKLVYYKTNESAIDSVKISDTYGALVVDRHFSISLCHRMEDENNVPNSTIQFYGDLTDINIFQTISRALFSAQFQFIRKVVIVLKTILPSNKTQMLRHESMTPMLNIADPIYGAPKPTFRDFMTPGMMITIIFILAVGLTAISFVTEKRESLLDRTLLTGVRTYEILLSQIFIQIFIIFVQISLLMVIIFPIFDIKNNGPYELIVFINVLQGVCGMTYGLFISTITSDEQSALMVAFGSFFPVILMSGVFWPLEGMISGLQIVSYLFPQTLAVISLRNIMQKGWTILHTYVWLGFVSTGAWIMIFIIGSLIFAAI